MADCFDGISKAIISNCTTQGSGGLEVVAWVFNRKELTITYDTTTKNLITSLANVSLKQGYKLTGIKKMLNAGSDLVVADDKADSWTHYFNFKQFEFSAADIVNVDNINDVIVFVENKDKSTTGDGVFMGFGCKFGLYKSTDTHRTNDDKGARNIELTSLADQEEPFSRYVFLKTDYATSKALLETLVTTPGT